MANSILIMDGDAMTRALRRIAHEILEHNPDPSAFALIGIPSRGVELARRLADLIEVHRGEDAGTGRHRHLDASGRSEPSIHAHPRPGNASAAPP